MIDCLLQQPVRFWFSTRNRRVQTEEKQMINDYGMGFGMGFSWLWMIPILVPVGLAIAALLKYVRR
jgi:hypothetical protein